MVAIRSCCPRRSPPVGMLRDRIQTSLNLALGSRDGEHRPSPSQSSLSRVSGSMSRCFGLDATQMVLFALTVVAAVLTVVPAGQRDCREQCTSSCSPPSCFSPLTREPSRGQPGPTAEISGSTDGPQSVRPEHWVMRQPAEHPKRAGPASGQPWTASMPRQLRQVLSGHRAG